MSSRSRTTSPGSRLQMSRTIVDVVASSEDNQGTTSARILVVDVDRFTT